MTPFAATYEPDGGGFPTLPVLTLVLGTLRRVEILKPHQPSPTRRVPAHGIANEPAREHRRLDRRWPPPRIAGVDRWRAKLRRALCDDATVVLETLVQKASEAGLL